MPPKHVLQQAVSAHHSHIVLIGVLVVVAACAILAAIGFVQEKRDKKRELLQPTPAKPIQTPAGSKTKRRDPRNQKATTK